MKVILQSTSPANSEKLAAAAKNLAAFLRIEEACVLILPPGMSVQAFSDPPGDCETVELDS